MPVLLSSAPAVSRQQQKAFLDESDEKTEEREKDSQSEREMTERKSERMIEKSA